MQIYAVFGSDFDANAQTEAQIETWTSFFKLGQ
jgi:hypothetical protein